MNNLKLAALLGIAVFLPSNLYAASPFGNRSPELDLSNTYHPPKLYIANPTVTETTTSTIKGTFEIQNAESYLINGQYRLELVGQIPEPTRKQFDLTEEATILHYQSEAFSIKALTPNETRPIPFTLAWPQLPAGTYTLRIQALTTTGRSLGWGDVVVTNEKSDPQFLYMYPGTIKSPEYEENLQPLSGPNINPGTTFVINGTIFNPSNATIQLTPQLTTYAFDPARLPQKPEVVRFAPQTAAAGESKEVSFPVQAALEPKVYFAQLELIDRQQGVVHSTVAQYRWVVRGAGADIIVMEPLYLTDKNELAMRLEYAGPADAETKVSAKIDVTIEDKQGILGTSTVSDLTLSDAISGGTVRIDLVRTPEEFVRIKTAVKDNKDATLYERTEDFPAEEVKKLQEPVNIFNLKVIILVVLAILAGLVYWNGIYRPRHKKRR